MLKFHSKAKHSNTLNNQQLPSTKWIATTTYKQIDQYLIHFEIYLQQLNNGYLLLIELWLLPLNYR